VISFRRAGFTLLEICLALLIVAMLLLLAVPGIAGLLAEQRLKQSFERFDKLVAMAKHQSVMEQRAYVMAWDRRAITLAPVDPNAPSANGTAVARLDIEQNESFELRRLAALSKDAPARWIFWSNGICEPAQVAFQGKAGNWLVSYDPLTARGVFLQSEVP
jgi:prepilin-type N-terminal cleavage/methylation domain-containing protein